MNAARFIAAFTITLFVASCTVNVEIPASGNFDKDRLARVDAVIEQAIERGEISGAVALVQKGGKVDYHKAFGYADIAAQKEMTTDTIFRIASMSKAVTSIGVMILYEQGHFRLNDPVSNYLPEFADMQVISEMAEDGTVAATVPAKTPIRIVDLLTHSSGISYTFMTSKLKKTYQDAGVVDGLTDKNKLLATQMKLLAQQPLLFEPGTKFFYGLNTDLLGYFIEVVSGQPLDEFFAEHITTPLKMDDTYFYLPAEKADRLATLYAHVDGKGLVVSDGTESDIYLDNPNYPVEGARTYFSGGAGLSSTASDYGRLIQMLANEGELDGARILSRKSVELMRSPRIDWDDDGVADMAFGFGVVSDLGKRGELGSIGAYAWGGAFNTTYWIDPEEDLIAVFMSQARPVDSDVSRRFETMVYQALR
jgi:CubicO group peptidase (beta-lactamase class C family)